MRISTRGEYGLRALFDLAQHYGKGPIQSEDIAMRQGIPPNYLNQMLILMRRAGLIESMRGPQGGHVLSRPPDQISLLEAMVVLEGPVLYQDIPREDLIPTQPDDACIIREVWQQLRLALESVLADITLEDLCHRKNQRTGHIMYHI